MAMKNSRKTKVRRKYLPLVVERGQDGFYVVECPLFDGCYSQGKTIDEALANIREVIALVLKEGSARETFRNYHAEELSLHTIAV